MSYREPSDSARSEAQAAAIEAYYQTAERALVRREVQRALEDARGMLALVHGEGSPLTVTPGDAGGMAIYLLDGRSLAMALAEEMIRTADWHHGRLDPRSSPVAMARWMRTELQRATDMLARQYEAACVPLLRVINRTIQLRRRWATAQGMALSELRRYATEVAASHLAAATGRPDTEDIVTALAVNRGADHPLAERHGVVMEIRALSRRPPEGADATVSPILTDPHRMFDLEIIELQIRELLSSTEPYRGIHVDRDAVSRALDPLAEIGRLVRRPLQELHACLAAIREEWGRAEARNREDPWVTVMEPQLTETSEVEQLVDRALGRPRVDMWRVREVYTRVRASEAPAAKAHYRMLRQNLQAERARREAATSPTERRKQLRTAERKPARAILAQARKRRP